jgi:hypothetical protein
MGRARNPENDAFYVLNLCDELLGVKSSREHTFEWLLGDLSPKAGRRKALPVDGYWESLSLVVEVMENQALRRTTS